VDHADDLVDETASGGTADKVYTTVSHTLASYVEQLYASGSSSISLTGNTLANTIYGNAGANKLNGKGGADKLYGYGGNDTYYVDNAGDRVVETSSGGTSDLVYSTVSHTLASYVEKLYASGSSSISLTGNTLANTIKGNAGANKINGGSGNDSLSGSSGNDKLSGGTGKDMLTGGSGRDVFVFNDKETSSSTTYADYITDFSGRSGDKIDLELVDANTRKSGDQDFSFIGTKAFSKAGEVRYEKTKSYTYVYLNTDTDKSAEAVIKLKGAMSLSGSWFDL
jgi:Ca2+-binding RTX toxin-like protein